MIYIVGQYFRVHLDHRGKDKYLPISLTNKDRGYYRKMHRIMYAIFIRGKMQLAFHPHQHQFTSILPHANHRKETLLFYPFKGPFPTFPAHSVLDTRTFCKLMATAEYVAER